MFSRMRTDTMVRRVNAVKSLFRRPQDSLAIHEAVKMYVKQKAAQHLGTTKEHISLEMPLFGARSLMWFVRSGDKTVMLRAYPSEVAYKAHFHRTSVELFQRHGMNVPAILDFHDDLRKYPAIIMLEQFIPGGPVGPRNISAPQAMELARQFARLHSVRSNRWGRPGHERSENFYTALDRHIRRDLCLVRATGLLKDKGRERALLESLLTCTQALQQITSAYSLTHNDVHHKNGIFTPDGDFYMIDLDRCQWLPPERELVNIYCNWLNRQPHLVERFNETYFSNITPGQYELTRKALPLFERLYLLDQVVKRTDRAERRGSENLERRDNAWAAFLRAMDSTSTGLSQ